MPDKGKRKERAKRQKTSPSSVELHDNEPLPPQPPAVTLEAPQQRVDPVPSAPSLDWLSLRMSFKLHVASDILCDMMRDQPELFEEYLPKTAANFIQKKEWRKSLSNCFKSFSGVLKQGSWPQLNSLGQRVAMMIVVHTASNYELDGLYEEGWGQELKSLMPHPREPLFDSDYQFILNQIFEGERDATVLVEGDFDRLPLDSPYLNPTDWWKLASVAYSSSTSVTNATAGAVSSAPAMSFVSIPSYGS